MGLLILLAEGLAVCLVAGVWYTAWLLTHPPRRTFASALARGRPGTPADLDERPAYEEWKFKSRGREFPVWDVRGGLPPGEGPTVIMTHGWGDSRIGGLTRLPALLPVASRVLLWDMAGHGEAPGVCALGTREVADLKALIEIAVKAGRPVVLMGWSLGAGVSIAAGADVASQVAGVIAEAAYRLPCTPARNVLRARGLPYRWNLRPALWCVGSVVGAGGWRGFDRVLHGARLACPLLVIHGTEDEICPVEDGRAIAASARRGRIEEVPGAGHAGLWTDARFSEACTRAVREFVESNRAGCADPARSLK